MNPENRPSVMTFIGRNRSLRIGLTIAYKIVSTKLAITNVVKLEKPTVGTAQAKIPSVIKVIKIDLIIYT